MVLQVSDVDSHDEGKVGNIRIWPKSISTKPSISPVGGSINDVVHMAAPKARRSIALVRSISLFISHHCSVCHASPRRARRAMCRICRNLSVTVTVCLFLERVVVMYRGRMSLLYFICGNVGTLCPSPLSARGLQDTRHVGSGSRDSRHAPTRRK